MSLIKNINNYLTNFAKMDALEAEKVNLKDLPDTLTYGGQSYARNKERDNELKGNQIAYDKVKDPNKPYTVSGITTSGEESYGSGNEVARTGGSNIGSDHINLGAKVTHDQLDSMNKARERYNSLPQKAKRKFGELMDKLSD